MPIFEYRCRSCGQVSEIWEGVGTRNDSRECKHCGGREIEKSPFPLPSGEESPAAGFDLLRPGGTMREASLLFRGRLPERVKGGQG